MDPITHALVGGVVAKSLKTSRRRFWILMFLGEAPDLDVFFGGLGPWAFWLQHRGITHSFFGAAIQAIFYATLFKKWDQGPFSERLWQYAIPLVLHALCDYLTSYGTPLLSPFNFKEYVGNLVPAITVVPLVFMMIGLIYMHKKQIDGWRATRSLWVAWGVYLLASLSSRAYASTFFKEEEGHVTIVAGLFNPFHWTAVVEPKACCGYHAHWIDVLRREKKPGPTITIPMEEFPIKSSMESPTTRRFVESIRWPVARVTPNPQGGWRVDWGKMIFSSRGMVRGLLSVDVSADGTVSNEHRIFSFWSPNE